MSSDVDSPVLNPDDRRKSAPSARVWVTVGVALVVVAALAFVLSRNGGSSDVGRASELRRSVEARKGGQDYVSVRKRPEVRAGDVVRTGADGLGQIEYGDGSLTRLDANTVFEVEELTNTSRRVMKASLSRGRVWNNVKKLSSSQDRFEIRTANAVATVRGTAFFCETNGLLGTVADTTCAQVEGRTDILFNNGLHVELIPGECTTNGGECKYTPAQLAKMGFLRDAAQSAGLTLPWHVNKQEKKDLPVAPPGIGRTVSGLTGGGGGAAVEDEATSNPKPSVDNHDDESDRDDNDGDNNNDSGGDIIPQSSGGSSGGGDPGEDPPGEEPPGDDPPSDDPPSDDPPDDGCEDDDNGHGNDCDGDDDDNPGGGN